MAVRKTPKLLDAPLDFIDRKSHTAFWGLLQEALLIALKEQGDLSLPQFERALERQKANDGESRD